MVITTSVLNNSVFTLETFIDEATAISLYKDIYNCLTFIKNGENHKISFEFLYRNCYKLTLNRYGGMLYGGILEFLIEMLRNEFTFQAESFNDIIHCWNKYELILDTLNDILMYLERNFVIPNIKIPMKKIGMCIFCKYYLLEKDRKFELFNLLYRTLNDFRKSESNEIEVSDNVRTIISKLYDLPSIEIDTKYLPQNSVDMNNFNDINCNYSTKDQMEYVTFKSKHPSFCINDLNCYNEKTIIFTFKYNVIIPTIDWNDHMMFRILFEYPFLDETRELHTRESENLLSVNDNQLSKICNYLLICEKRYYEEKRLVESYLFHEMWNNIIKEMDLIWIISFCNNYFNKDNNKFIFEFFSIGGREDLQRFFKIISRVPNCLHNLKHSLKNYVYFCLTEIFSSISVDFTENEYVKCMQNINTLRNRCEYIIQECFYCNQNFNQIIVHSFEDFLQKQDFELINNWFVLGFDTFLRNKNEKNVEVLLWLFKFIFNKEDFEVKYRSLLCKRILEFPEKNNTIEHNMLVKFRNECGNGYTLKLEGILSDLIQSEVINSEYYQTVAKNDSKLDVKFYLLTLNYWILPPLIDCIIPNKINDNLKCFEKFHCERYEKRRLQWHLGVGHATITSNIKLKNNDNFIFTFDCSTLQMLILSIFNTYDYISFGEIQNVIKCSDLDALRRNLFWLSCDKESSILKFVSYYEWKEIIKYYKIQDKTRGNFHIPFDVTEKMNELTRSFKYTFSPLTISDVDIFCLNFDINVQLISGQKNFSYQYYEFSNKRDQTLKFEQTQLKLEDKAHLIDSIIIKILKRNKTLHIDELISKTLESSVSLSKEHNDLVIERIESLCKKEFISRDTNSRNKFNYVP